MKDWQGHFITPLLKASVCTCVCVTAFSPGRGVDKRSGWRDARFLKQNLTSQQQCLPPCFYLAPFVANTKDKSLHTQAHTHTDLTELQPRKETPWFRRLWSLIPWSSDNNTCVLYLCVCVHGSDRVLYVSIAIVTVFICICPVWLRYVQALHSSAVTYSVHAATHRQGCFPNVVCCLHVS